MFKHCAVKKKQNTFYCLKTGYDSKVCAKPTGYVSTWAVNPALQDNFSSASSWNAHCIKPHFPVILANVIQVVKMCFDILAFVQQRFQSRNCLGNAFRKRVLALKIRSALRNLSLAHKKTEFDCFAHNACLRLLNCWTGSVYQSGCFKKNDLEFSSFLGH